MKKKMTLGLIVMTMAISLSLIQGKPAHAAGNSYNIWIGGEQVTDENASDILDDGGSISYNATTNTLTLNNADVYGEQTEEDVNLGGIPSIGNDGPFQQAYGYIHATQDLNINVIGTNYIQSWSWNYSSVFLINGDVTFTGTGSLDTSQGSSLTLTDSKYCWGSFGITGDCTITGPTINYDAGGDNDCSIGLWVDGNLVMNSGKLDITSRIDSAIEVRGNCTVNGGTIETKHDWNALDVGGTLTINGGDITAETNPEIDQSDVAAICANKLVITGGTVKAKAGGNFAATIKSYSEPTLTGAAITTPAGQKFINTSSDAYWSILKAGATEAITNEWTDEWDLTYCDATNLAREVVISPVHVCANNLTKHTAVEATCTKTGASEYYSCTCGKYYSDSAATKEISENAWVTAKKAHEVEAVEAKTETRTEAGNIAYYRCKNCGTFFSDETCSTELTEEDVTIPANPDMIYGTAEYSVAKTQTYNGATIEMVTAVKGCTVENGSAIDAGTYTATVKLEDGYTWEDGTTADKQVSYKINKAEQKVKVTTVNKSVKRSTIRKKSVSFKNMIVVKGNQATPVFTRIKGNKNITVSKNGTLTFKKHWCPFYLGKHYVNVKVKVPATKNYKAYETTVRIYVNVK